MLSLWLIALHMLGDYITQNQWMVVNKFKHWDVRAIHVFAYCMPFLPLVWKYQQSEHAGEWFMLLLFVTHFITDSRRWASDAKWWLKPLMVDQTIHLLTLAALGSLFLKG